MARRVFFSFHYQLDVWRVNQIRNLPNIVGCAAAGFQDASLWEEAKRKGDASVKRMIDDGLNNTSVTVVCIGHATASRKYIYYEIDRSIQRGNAIIGLRIHHLKDHLGHTAHAGMIPPQLSAHSCPIYAYDNHPDLALWIESAAQARRFWG